MPGPFAVWFAVPTTGLAVSALAHAERLPVLIVDNFLSNPEVLVEYAARHCAFEGVSDAFYPGIRAPIPPIYSYALRAFLGIAISSAFDLRHSRVTGELSHFSLVTTVPARSTP